MPDDAEQVRASVVSRYGRLAEAAAAGQRVTGCGPGETCFGAAAYDGSAFPRGRCGPAWDAATLSRSRP